MSLLFRFEIIGHFFNTLTAENEHYSHKSENLPQPIKK